VTGWGGLRACIHPAVLTEIYLCHALHHVKTLRERDGACT
jgi:hypothetical protein